MQVKVLIRGEEKVKKNLIEFRTGAFLDEKNVLNLPWK